MLNRWNAAPAPTFETPLDECVYGSRLLGAEVSLVLHGGGNTSVKITEEDIHGEPIDVLYVKGSGWDLDGIEAAGFAPLDLTRVRRLIDLDDLSDTAMVNELSAALIDPAAPAPSVEAILHAIVPDPAVQHAHPDAVLAISNTEGGEERLAKIYGSRVVVVPYAMSGFTAAKAAALALGRESNPDTIGFILMNHGVFTFGETSREAYERMTQVVTEAEDYLDRESTGGRSPVPDSTPPETDRLGLAALRRQLSTAAGTAMIMRRHRDASSWAFSLRGDVEEIASQGPATPDHVIWTKRVPLFGRDVEGYAEGYAAYYEEHAAGRGPLRMLDPAPRIIIDPEFGLLSAGPDLHAEQAAGDIYRQTIEIIESATGLGGYSVPPASDMFDLEYWDLEQAKLERVSEEGEFAGEIAVVTGAASGIGRACAAALVDMGAAVVGLDLNPAVVDALDAPGFLGIPCDVTSLDAVADALDTAVERFGGVDMLVASAGLFPESAPIASHDATVWRRAMAVNADGLVQLLALVHPLLCEAPRGGRVAMIGSKNVAAPGPGASAYSASKAAANQIARVAALEWAADGIRVNSVHPDAVFDTALWTAELLAERAARYGMTIEEYKRRNLLGVEISSAAVAAVVATLLGSVFTPITGAHIPIDGGNDRVI